MDKRTLLFYSESSLEPGLRFEYDARVMVEKACPGNGYMWCEQNWWWDPPVGDELIADTAIKTLEPIQVPVGLISFVPDELHKVWQTPKGCCHQSSAAAVHAYEPAITEITDCS